MDMDIDMDTYADTGADMVREIAVGRGGTGKKGGNDGEAGRAQGRKDF